MLEKMHQPPNSTKPDIACPPGKGPVFINYAWWFTDLLVAPVSRPDSEYDEPLMTVPRDDIVPSSMPRPRMAIGFIAC